MADKQHNWKIYENKDESGVVQLRDGVVVVQQCTGCHNMRYVWLQNGRNEVNEFATIPDPLPEQCGTR